MEIKKSPVKSESAVVGVAEHPVFDEKNPTVGLQEIMSFDWKAAGYNSAEHAIVSLVNTQHATNLKNEIRSKASGKLTSDKLNNLALQKFASLPPEEMARISAAGDLANTIEKFKAEIKAEHEESRKKRLAEMADQENEGGSSNE
jgi:hypothetical protein